jgi:Domain of unknown function (DUF6484)
MKSNDDPFVPLAELSLADDTFDALQQRPVSLSPVPLPAPAIARLHGFDLLDIPQVDGLAACPGRVIAARSTVALRRVMIGREVLVLFEQGDIERPIIIGVIEPQALQDHAAPPSSGVQVRADGERHLIEAEREIVLRCGEASITLTRAGKVIIRGAYILSRSSGYNKIKGAAIDIN